jgi:uncharacterized protein (DUF736 family)
MKIQDAMKNTFIKLKGGKSKVAEDQIKGNKPDFKGSLEIAAWINTDKNGNEFVSVQIGNRANLFQNNSELKDYKEDSEIENIFE